MKTLHSVEPKKEDVQNVDDNESEDDVVGAAAENDDVSDAMSDDDMSNSVRSYMTLCS